MKDSKIDYAYAVGKSESYEVMNEELKKAQKEIKILKKVCKELSCDRDNWIKLFVQEQDLRLLFGNALGLRKVKYLLKKVKKKC